MIKSPVTYSDNCRKIMELDSNKIENLYKDINIDISKIISKNTFVSIYECSDTGYRFYYPDSVFGDSEFYEALSNIEGYYPQKKWEYDKAISKISRNDKVLEIGSGSGIFLEMLREKSIEALGLEINPVSLNIAKEKKLNVKLETIQEHAVSNIEKYDVVVLFQVLEHIYNIKDFLESALLCLKKEGKLIIAVPNNNPFLYKNDIYHTLNLPPHHAGLWNKSCLENLQLFFPLKNAQIFYEPLKDYQRWFTIFKENKKQNGQNYYVFFLNLIPRILYKRILKIFVEGAYLLAIFNKK